MKYGLLGMLGLSAPAMAEDVTPRNKVCELVASKGLTNTDYSTFAANIYATVIKQGFAFGNRAETDSYGTHEIQGRRMEVTSRGVELQIQADFDTRRLGEAGDKSGLGITDGTYAVFDSATSDGTVDGKADVVFYAGQEHTATSDDTCRERLLLLLAAEALIDNK